MAPQLSTHQPASLVFFLFLVEFHQDRGIEWKEILYPTHPVLLCSPRNRSSFQCAMILTQSTACLHVFFSETKYCYSWNDVRSQLIPFSTIPRSWTWKWANLQTLKIHKKINENSYKDNFFTVVIRRKRKFILPKKNLWVLVLKDFLVSVFHIYYSC